MPKTVSAAQARNNFADLIGEAHFGDEAFIVERLGKPFAVILGYKMYQKLLKAQERAKAKGELPPDTTDQARLF
jgi:prevent-host-death family protein